MESKIKKIVVGLGIAGIAMIVGFLPTSPPEPLTVNEWQALVKIYDYEIEKAGGAFQIKNWTKENDFKKLNAKVRERAPTEKVEIDGVEMTPKDYETFRNNLLEKTEKQ